MAKGNHTRKLMAAGTATLIAEPALAFAHQGGLGVIVGLVAGAVAYGILDDVEQRTSGRHLRPPAVGLRQGERQHAGLAGTGKSNPLSRLLLVGKSARSTDEEEEADTVFIEENEDEGLLAETLELGGLRPHADTVFSNRLAILGMSGAGKSNTVAALVEELGQYDAPLILFDLKPEYGLLCERPYLSNPARAHAQNLTAENAAAIAARIMDKRLQVVVDLTSYPDDAEAALVMASLVQGVLRYQQTRENADRIPCTLVVDEAHYWLPENEGQSTIRHVKHPHTGQSLLPFVQQVFFHVAKVGRSFGMGLIVSTQRPADVDKQLISQAEWRFLLKAMDPADLKVYRSYGLADEVAQALNPKKGEAYVIGPDGSRGVYHIRRRYSPDVAQSPGLANIRNAGARSVRSPFPVPGGVERGNTHAALFPGNTATSEKQPVERVGTVPDGWEHSPAFGNTGNAPDEMEEAEGYTHEEEMQVLLAYAELCKGSEPVSRRAIRGYLEWSNRQFSRVIKPVCDKHAIAVRES